DRADRTRGAARPAGRPRRADLDVGAALARVDAAVPGRARRARRRDRAPRRDRAGTCACRERLPWCGPGRLHPQRRGGDGRAPPGARRTFARGRMTPDPARMARFITIDGVEGAGKSTQAARLADALRRDGHEVVLTREPGGTELGRALRRMLL